MAVSRPQWSIAGRAGIVALAVATLSAGAESAEAHGPGAPPSVVSTDRQAAGGPVTVGQHASEGTTSSCLPGASIDVQAAGAAGTASYQTPSAGVVTSFTTRANATAGQVQAVFTVPDSLPGQRSIVAKSSKQAVTTGMLNTFAVRVPVPASASLGLWISADGMACSYAAAPADVINLAVADPDTTTSFPTPYVAPGFRLNISAVLEPDADGDGYGDVSQDLCPQSSKTQSACPAPDTTLTKVPKKVSTKRKVKVKFTSVEGATYGCAVDGKAARPCASPFKKRFRYGKHTVLITATSPYGITELAPAEVKFKIVRPHRQH